MACAGCASLSAELMDLKREVASLSVLLKEKLSRPSDVLRRPSVSEGRSASPPRGREELGWRVVKGSAKPPSTVFASRSPPIPTSNRFDGLEEDEADTDSEILFVGDSMIRGLGSIFPKKTGRRCRAVCLPGAGVERVTQSLSVSEGNLSPTVVVTGTNDVASFSSEALKRRYGDLLRELKERRSPSVLVGILPRMSAGGEWSSRAIGVNRWLAGQCSSLGVSFLDLWGYFAWRPYLYRRDGIHLTDEGKAFIADALGDLLGERSLYQPILGRG